jgi:hypothetical protein
MGKGTNYVREPPLAIKNILIKREGKFESVISLEKSSLVTTTCFKIALSSKLITFSTYRKHIKPLKEGQ